MLWKWIFGRHFFFLLLNLSSKIVGESYINFSTSSHFILYLRYNSELITPSVLFSTNLPEKQTVLPSRQSLHLTTCQAFYHIPPVTSYRGAALPARGKSRPSQLFYSDLHSISNICCNFPKQRQDAKLRLAKTTEVWICYESQQQGLHIFTESGKTYHFNDR